MKNEEMEATNGSHREKDTERAIERAIERAREREMEIDFYIKN